MAERVIRRAPSSANSVDSTPGGTTSSETKPLRGRVLPAKQIVKDYEEGISERGVTMIDSGDMYISSGSTLLDLALTGTRVKGGGVPGGIIMEVYGEAGLGKTAILAEIAASCQVNKGALRFNDPEARLDQEYSQIYGMSLEGKNYVRIKYVEECLKDIRKWNPVNTKTINVYGCDSLAALTTELEMGDKGDKMGMRRAKEFSSGLRQLATEIGVPHKLLVCTNQVRQGDFGTTTPGGKGIGFYSTIRLEIKKQSGKGKPYYITKTVKIGSNDKEVSKTIGINIIATTRKNTKNDPFREAPISIVFGYGIDDVRANLQYLKDNTGDTTYDCIGKTYQSMEKAINYVEVNSHEKELKDKVTNLWYEIENKLKVNRIKKTRK